MHHIHGSTAVEMLHMSFVKTGGAVTEGEEGFFIKQTKNEDLVTLQTPSLHFAERFCRILLMKVFAIWKN